jgi:hypothetical protein
MSRLLWTSAPKRARDPEFPGNARIGSVARPDYVGEASTAPCRHPYTLGGWPSGLARRDAEQCSYQQEARRWTSLESGPQMIGS